MRLFAHGDSESLYAILDTFYESTVENVKELEALMAKEDILDIEKIAHRMLPMFKQIKAKKVVPILEKLEHPDQYKLNKPAILSLTKEGVYYIKELLSKLKVEN